MSKIDRMGFDAFVKLMAKALKLGRAHRVHRKPKATPLELAAALKLQDARSVHILYLREAYLAGHSFE